MQERVKVKHNKKRNTAFLYETLVKELTKSIVNKDNQKRKVIVGILKEHFGKNSVLHKELDVYKSLYESKGLDNVTATRLIQEAKRVYLSLNSQDIFNQQTIIINDVNKKVNASVFTNFMSNYKDLATIAQIFDNEIPMKTRVILEEYLIDRLSTQDDPQNNLKPIDSLVYKEFVKKFNDKYGASLMEEQKQLLTKYIASYSNDDIDFKVYLNEEIGRIKQIVISSKQITESKQREGLVNILESFRTNQITPAMIEKVLKLQQLVKELV
jgi:hypothetical protein